MARYFTLKEPSLPAIDQVGGKGLSLIYLASKGFQIPPAIVLPTEFFCPWIEMLKRTPEWEAFVRAVEDGQSVTAAELQHRSQTLALTADQQQMLAEVRQFFQSEGIDRLAVRSSSPEEDLEGASFAGIYETVLGVTADGLEVAVKTCFASALDERVVAYKRQNGFDPFDPKIAVVIQKQIAADVSGVAFSLNPVFNCYDECVINANFGLGETVVDGTVIPDQAVVDKVSKVILEKTPGKKDVAVYLLPDGGTEPRSVDSPNKFCLSDVQILAIADLAARVESVYGKPMDIEWTYEGERFYLLQARPITAYYRLPDEMITAPGAQKHLYHDANLTEQGLTDNMSPLGEEIFIRGTSMMMEVLGADPSVTTIDRGLIFGCAGRTYTNIGRMTKLIGKKNVINTFRHVDAVGTEILEKMDLKEYIPKKLPKGLRMNFYRTALGGLKIFIPSLRASWNPEAYLRAYLAANDQLWANLKTAFEGDAPFEEFYNYAIVEVSKHISFVGLPAVMAAERARTRLKKMFKRAPDAVQERLQHIEQAFPHNITIEMGLTLFELSQFPDVQETASAEAFVQKLETNQLSPEFKEKWQFFLDNFGMRCPKEADVATPRYYERPWDVFTLLKTMGTYDDPEVTPRGVFENAAKRRVESVYFLEEYLAQESPRKVKTFRKHYKVLETLAAYRETPKYYMIIAIDYIRRRALALARPWVEAGRLDTVEQIFDLELADIVRAQQDPEYDIRAVAQANRDYFAQFNIHNDPPVLIDSRGRIPRLPSRPLKENELAGTPVSPGVVTGPVKVLSRADEKPILPGEILVAKATDPGWTTLFLNASGVLLESGGTLQHGAAVARESCKPCIVGIERLTKTLRDGQMVEMDGAAGIVKILG